jgi:hypothetical protein
MNKLLRNLTLFRQHVLLLYYDLKSFIVQAPQVSLFTLSVVDESMTFEASLQVSDKFSLCLPRIAITSFSWGQYYKTLYGCNLQISKVS